MPEGPEIRREADAIAAAIAKRPLERIEFHLPRLAGAAKRLRGAVVESVFPHGKALLIRFDNGLTLYTHNLLYGRWYVVRVGERPRTNRTLRVAIASGTHEALLYSASQIALLDDAEVAAHAYLSKLGPDLLDPELTPSALARRLAEPRWARKNLAALLLDQGFLAGSGNYLRSEILFEAKLDPARRAASLSPAERSRFARAAIRVGTRAYRLKGVTNDPKRVARLKKKNPKKSYRYAVYTREGEACYACGSLILREALTSRRIYRCPVCQPRSKALDPGRRRDDAQRRGVAARRPLRTRVGRALSA